MYLNDGHELPQVVIWLLVFVEEVVRPVFFGLIEGHKVDLRGGKGVVYEGALNGTQVVCT